MFLISLFFATFTFDITILGFEQLPKIKRENYIILLSLTRITGIFIICFLFYFLNKWMYFFCIEIGLLAIFSFLFIKYTYESPHYIEASTGSTDHCKYILNQIATINNEDIITEKLS